jgi:alpha-tubulin suppressor-like RCC1 family protein
MFYCSVDRHLGTGSAVRLQKERHQKTCTFYLTSLASLEHESPSIYGPARYIDTKQAITHCSSSHVVLIDTLGVAYTFGRNDKGQLGNGTKTPDSNPQKITLPSKVTKAATGRGFTLLVTEDYKVYGAGDNKLSQALAASGPDPLKFKELSFFNNLDIVDVACGAEFAIALTKEGNMYSWGLPQYGQLGDGSDHQYIAGTNKIVFQPQTPHLINVPLQPNCNKVKIVQISCGINHSICLDDTGVYV